jgi:hypothetical protein
MGSDFTDWRDFFFWWVASLFAAGTVVAAKLGLRLYGLAGDPPLDPALAAHWHRRRRYVAIGEVSALPAFATVSVVLVSFYHLNPVAAVLIAMAQGMVGFALLLDGAAWLFRKRIGLPAPAASDTGHG